LDISRSSHVLGFQLAWQTGTTEVYVVPFGRRRPEISTLQSFEEALSRGAREFPEEAAAYEDSIVEGEKLPMEILV
jgi:hypothetical protein